MLIEHARFEKDGLHRFSPCSVLDGPNSRLESVCGLGKQVMPSASHRSLEDEACLRMVPNLQKSAGPKQEQLRYFAVEVK